MSCCNNDYLSKNESIMILNKAREAAACAEANCGSSFTNATNAATSATNAANSATSAAASETNVENIWEDFQERYMGPYPSAPATTIEGALYWDTTANSLYVWDGSGWVALPTGFNEFTNFPLSFTTAIAATNLVQGQEYQIETIGSTPTNWVAIGAPSATVGARFTKNATAATGNGTAKVTRDLNTRFADVVNVKDFGAVGDGIADDTVAIQAALNYSVLNPLAIKPVFVPSGEYRVGRIVLPYGTIMSGAGGTVEALTLSGTRFLQNANDDIFIFNPINFGGTYSYWAGKISDISIIGYNTNTTGYAFNSKDSLNNPVYFVDQTQFENMTIRNMPQGGFFIRSAYPLTIKNVKFLWNGGPGITCTRVGGIGLYQGVHFSDVSGDGNINGLLNFSNMSRNDGFLISNLKSEARVNNVYGGGVGQQLNAIVITNSSDSVIAINGANHISSIPDGLGNTQKPGDFINITDGNLPKITWNGVIVGFPASSTGTDPLIVKSTISYVYQPDYSISSGTFNVQFPFHASKMLFHRNAVTGATPSVAKCNALTIDNSSATTITNIIDSNDGQFIILSFLNSNTTVQNNTNIALNDGSDWTPAGNSTLSLIYIGGKWREVARSYGASTGTYTVNNLITDRTYDANATTVSELANVLGTLIQDLNTRGVI